MPSGRSPVIATRTNAFGDLTRV
ncbi:hypothetical protein F383_26965 [Gossypium arboreum]|uniref:Uncharacterized protein n=1 Tax=Gossypium arboreum TaxID=29729 RepID=A0A0B0NPE0_GOSAR|nr:hypothetical protein F383_18768 [Gossypium arboreum]KHG20999.1 hypothetical protein F383_26965 [Gossypium arboreum]